MFKLGLEKAEEPETKLPTSVGSLKKQDGRILNQELPRSVGAQYATGDQWRNNSRRHKVKAKTPPRVDVTGDRSKVQCCKEQCCIGT